MMHAVALTNNDNNDYNDGSNERSLVSLISGDKWWGTSGDRWWDGRRCGGWLKDHVRGRGSSGCCL